MVVGGGIPFMFETVVPLAEQLQMTVSSSHTRRNFHSTQYAVAPPLTTAKYN